MIFSYENCLMYKKTAATGNPEGLGAELFETLVKMAPTKEEELKLRDYNGDTSKLGAAERFLKAVLNIPFAFRRVDAMLYRANFDTEIKYLQKSFETLEVILVNHLNLLIISISDIFLPKKCICEFLEKNKIDTLNLILS